MEELEPFAEALTAAGVQPHSGLRPITGFEHSIELRDPEGIELELHLAASA